MVFIGIRDYTAGTYPAQTGLLSDDGFIFNAIKTLYNQNRDQFNFIGVTPPATLGPVVLRMTNLNYHPATKM